jgi:hypothetical protein
MLRLHVVGSAATAGGAAVVEASAGGAAAAEARGRWDLGEHTFGSTPSITRLWFRRALPSSSESCPETVRSASSNLSLSKRKKPKGAISGE